MKAFLKNNIVYIIFLLVFGLIGGYYTALYSIEITDPDLLEQTIQQIGSLDVLIIVTVLQSTLYSVVLGLIGKSLAQKIDLWRGLDFEKYALVSTGLASLIGGSIFILSDVLVFGQFSEVIKGSYAEKPTFNYIIASITYGGVVEEVMLRLFWMSLVAFVIWRISRNRMVSETQIILANIIAALLFAAGHLPATVSSIGISPMIIARCFLMNGGYGLLFGRLYRKYGIQYAMLAHAGVHIVSKLIWILFI